MIMRYMWLLVTFSALGFNDDEMPAGLLACTPPSGSCFMLAYTSEPRKRLPFHQAQSACQARGASLASIRTRIEQYTIQAALDYIWTHGWTNRDRWAVLNEVWRERMLRPTSTDSFIIQMNEVESTAPNSDFWIGLRRDRQKESCEEQYTWIDGDASPYRNWHSDEPTCGGESCVVLYFQPLASAGPGGPYLHYWNDDSCDMRHNYICQYRKGALDIPPLSTNISNSTQGPAQSADDFQKLLLSAIPAIPCLLILLGAICLLFRNCR